jgi:hypothetical protein
VITNQADKDDSIDNEFNEEEWLNDIDTNNSSDSDEENKTGFQREMLDYEIIDKPSIRIKF